MSISIQNEENYAAFVVRVPELRKADNSDRLYVLSARGTSIVVNDSWQDRVGDLALIVPAEAQVSFVLAHELNLHRHANLNADESVTGYVEDNRRIRPVRLRGNMSNGLALPLSEVIEIFGDSSDLREGVTLDTLNGHELTRKFLVPVKASSLGGQQVSTKKPARVDEKVFPQHVNTAFWERNLDKVNYDQTLIVTQKIHGTSVRFGNVPVKAELTWLERLAKKIGIRVQEKEFDLVAGSRKVIKDPKVTGQNHFYNSDVWTKALHAWGEFIPEGFIVYGELVGFVDEDGDAIQKGYTYEAPRGSTHLYVYRVTRVDARGVAIDLTWDQVRQFAAEQGLQTVPELWRGPKIAFNLDSFKEKAFIDVHYDALQSARTNGVSPYRDRPVGLSNGGTSLDEGIVVRVDGAGYVPDLFKYKNDSFYEFEAKATDAGEENIEG